MAVSSQMCFIFILLVLSLKVTKLSNLEKRNADSSDLCVSRQWSCLLDCRKRYFLPILIKHSYTALNAMSMFS